MKWIHDSRIFVSVGVCAWFLAGATAMAQRGSGGPTASSGTEPPALVGQVVAYEVDKSITIEIAQRGGQTQKTEFAIVTGQSKVELAGDAKTIAVGTKVSVWPDKENPKLAARIVAASDDSPGRTSGSTSSSSAPTKGRAVWVEPTVIGHVVAYQPNKSVTIEVRVQRGVSLPPQQFKLNAQSKIELPADTKTLAVGMVASVWPDKYDKKLAVKISASTGENQGRNAKPATPVPATRPSAKPSAAPPTKGGGRPSN